MEWSIILSSSAIGTVIGAIIAWTSSHLTNRAADRRQDKQMLHDLMTVKGEEIYQHLFQDQTHLMLKNANYTNMLESAINGQVEEIETAIDSVGSLLNNDLQQLVKDGSLTPAEKSRHP
jgi:hypothetical protein